ncbi:hypothetical protein [Acidihalobacter prosperus]|uniref:L-lactate permease n=1 Tax=Acidihalobacter prosperus TaxID=160660 RepID=A0A1A6C4K2_9GAMM|nr:hypothetical protein [Acidihalobacter prosperus]OBS09479.1 hypothetical protein Thpro_021807 [Acidihalobacter prosperus]
MILDLLPFAGLLTVIASRRAGVWVAALAGLTLTLPAFLASTDAATPALARLAGTSLHGLWLSWLAVSVIVAGLLFH